MSIKQAILKAKLLLNKQNINSLPVDITKIAHNCKFNIIKSELPEGVSGIIEPLEHKIYVNKEDNERRRRFTIAHELGHYFLNHCDGIHVDKSFRDTKSSEGLYNVEIEANNFAAELLMPTDKVTKLFDSIVKGKKPLTEEMISTLSSKFNVSPEAMKNKLKNLGYVVDIEQF